MYAAHYKLSEPPFSIAPDPAFLYMSARHQEALGHLLYGTGQYGGFVQLTGEVGTGKTTIVRTLLAQKLENVDIAMIHNPRQNEFEFVASICDELGVIYRHDDRPVDSIKTLVDALNQHLLASHAAGRRTVLIIDEAQNLPQPVLEQVRLLTNLETTKEKLLRIMLIGQPELSELLARPDLRQLASRITARFHLTPLTVVETQQYIIHRLHVAGGPADLFTDAAMRRVHHFAKGIPRQINIICDRSLLGAYARGLRAVTPAVVDQAAKEVFGGEPQRSASDKRPSRFSARNLPLPWVEAALAIAALLVAGVLLNQVLTRPIDAATASTRSTMVDAAQPAARQQAVPVTKSTEQPPQVGIGALRATAQPLSAVLAKLIGLWQPGLKIPSGENVCSVLARNGLDCYRGEATLDELRQMNRPAVLTLSLEDGSRQFVLLRALEGSEAVLDTGNGPLRLPLALLEPLWTGEFLLLWQRPIEEAEINPQTRGDAIVWLRRMLAKAEGKTLTGALPTNYGPELRAQLLRFQTSNGLRSDGVAGTRTLIALVNLTPKPGIPSLEDAR